MVVGFLAALSLDHIYNVLVVFICESTPDDTGMEHISALFVLIDLTAARGTF